MMNIKSKKTKSFKYFAMALLAVSSMSCSQNEDVINEFPAGKDAYLCLSLNAPATKATKAALTSEQESKLNNLYYFGFDAAGKSVDRGFVEIDATGVKTAAIKVNSKMTKIFVVVNPTEAIKALTGVSFEAIRSQVIATDAAHAAADNFMMTNTAGLVDVVPQTDAEGIETTAVTVDRVVSKVTLKLHADMTAPAGVTATITKSLLNITNKLMFTYAPYITYDKGTEEENLVDKSYRIDPNFATLIVNTPANITEYKKNFSVLENAKKPAATANTFLNLDIAQYCGENTADDTAINLINLTSIVAEGTYFPASYVVGDSWFMYNGENLTFTDLSAILGGADTPRKAAVRAILTAVGKKGPSADAFVLPTNYASLALFETDFAHADGYIFSTVQSGENYMRYYKAGVCYYSIPLTHDNTMTAESHGNDLGRWGIVRNNAYTATVNSITKPGLPFIPDPTDPDIIDPEKPDPEKPDKSAMDVTITVKDWATWSQGVDL